MVRSPRLSLAAAAALVLAVTAGVSGARAAVPPSPWQILHSVSPDPTKVDNSIFTGVSAASASDGWAVGQTQSSASGPIATLTEHFDGTSWSVQPSPDPGNAGNDELFAVASSGTQQLDTVGGAAVAGDPCLTDVSGKFCLRTLALHTTSG